MPRLELARCDALRRLAASALLWLLPSAAGAEVLQLAVQTPRPFGYVIGDTIEHSIRLELAEPFELDLASLPRAGRLDLQLELRAPAVRERGRRYDITLTYQLIGSANDDRPLVIPGYELSITDGERVLPVWIPEWSFRMTALLATREMADVSASSLRPDRGPPPLPLAAHRQRLALVGLGLLVALGCLVHVYFGLPWLARRKRPFGKALRRLRRLERRPWNAASQREALRLLHQAFNLTAGRPLFASGLEALFREQPRFAPVRAPVEAFYLQSRQIFFEAEPARSRELEGPSMASLIALCRRCRDIERGSG